MCAGIAASITDDTIEIGLSANDSTYSIDFTVRHLDGANKSKEERSKMVADFVVDNMHQYEEQHL